MVIHFYSLKVLCVDQAGELSRTASDRGLESDPAGSHAVDTTPGDRP